MAIYVAVSCRPAGVKPNGTHFEPQRASVRAGTLGIACESGPHDSALRLKIHKVSAIRRKASGNDCIRKSCKVALSEKCPILRHFSGSPGHNNNPKPRTRTPTISSVRKPQRNNSYHFVIPVTYWLLYAERKRL